MLPSALKQSWSPDVLAFYDHWRSLRGEDLMPTSETYLDKSSPDFMGTSYICDLTTEGAIVRFHGVELIERWGADYTGQDLNQGRREPIVERAVSNMTKVVSQPCGWLIKLSFSTSKSRLLHSELIQLPLKVQEGRPPRLISYSQKDVGAEWEETAVRYMETHGMHWVDVGAGVPADPPFDLMATT